MEHDPVMVTEVLAVLEPAPDRVIVDGTLGGGGHAEALLTRGATVFALDRDAGAVTNARARFAGYGERFNAVHGAFGALADLVSDAHRAPVNGVLLDLGVSSVQLDDAARGFSFRRPGPLDMRMDRTVGDEPGHESLAEKLARVNTDDLERVLRDYGEERRARAIARSIIAMRDAGELRDTADLARAVLRVMGPAGRRAAIHPATRTFQALRLWVNGELDQLDLFLNTVWDIVAAAGRVAILSYHSLEDRRVKHAFRSAAAISKAEILTRKPVTPAAQEIARNPRARSAKLRAAEKR